MNGTIDPEQDYLREIDGDADRRWPAITAARKNAQQVLQLLRDSLAEFPSEDLEVVVFGSLARREWTSGSDVDWTLLVDG